MPDPTHLVAMPCEKSTRHVHGAIKLQCCVCTCDVWVAPSGQRTLAKTSAKIICLDCFGQLPGAMEAIKKAKPTPEQLGEIVGELLAGKSCANP